MNPAEEIEKIYKNYEAYKAHLNNEATTKNALIEPFLRNVLGYDASDPTEVITEYDADMNKPKGEKVDYCIKKEDKPIILVECKSCREGLDEHRGQLRSYFNAVPTAKVGILTNGLEYKFYADLDEDNIMDKKSFLRFHIKKVEQHTLEKLKRFHKIEFNLQKVIDRARELRSIQITKDVLSQNLKNPEDDFLKFFIKKVHKGKVTTKVCDELKKLIVKAFSEYFTEYMNERLKAAISNQNEEDSKEKNIEDVKEEDKNVITDEERSAFRIVQAILLEEITPQDILFDKKKSLVIKYKQKKKTLCMFQMHKETKTIEFPHIPGLEAGISNPPHKEYLKHKIHELNDIYSYRQILLQRIAYLKKSNS